VLCPLCNERRARRGCPALGRQICAVCCATKRLVEIQCPSDCPYLTSAREHPSAAVMRQRQHDVSVLVQSMRDLNDRQSQLLFLVNTFLQRYEAPELQPVIDADVTEAAAALASTFETAARGVIYEHRPAGLPADRLAAALKPLIVEAGQNGGTAFERDAAVVLRRVEEASRAIAAADPSNRRAYLELLNRVLRKSDEVEAPAGGASDDPPRLIVP
jgi:hypothetical protein